MTETELAELLDACKPTPAMWGSGGAKMFPTPQENATRAWAKLGDKYGFDPMTCEPVPGKSQRVFTAIPVAKEVA